jgi:hypothetical protein
LLVSITEPSNTFALPTTVARSSTKFPLVIATPIVELAAGRMLQKQAANIKPRFNRNIMTFPLPKYIVKQYNNQG